MATFLVGGASGFIGTQLVRALRADGHRLTRLTRARHSLGSMADGVAWDPQGRSIDRGALARVRPDVVINLAGEPIAQRWTSARKKRIRESRVHGTSVLAAALAELSEPPMVFVSGSAIGYYGADRGEEVLDETSAPGADYLATVAREWEDSARPALDAGIRVVTLRMGIVLGRDGGALARLLLPFRLGVGGRIGSGRQWMSWISLEDAVQAIRFVAETPSMAGPANIVAPEPVRNAEFSKVLGHVLRRPSFVPTPAILLELLFGSMARNTILADQRVIPRRLASAGFEFRHPRLEEALRRELSR